MFIYLNVYMMNLCLIQARYRSTRLPGKVLKKVNGTALLEYQYKRIQQAKKIDKIIVATSDSPADDKIALFCQRKKIPVFRGSESDVLSRFYDCTLKYPDYSNIIRTTGDCPLIDSQVMDEVIELFTKSKVEYASNVEPPTYPDGMDTEIFKRTTLHKVNRIARLSSQREHVTWLIRRSSKFRKANLNSPYDFSHFRLTVDEPADFKVIKFLISHSKITDSYLHYISLLTKNPRIMMNNINIKRNLGLLKSLKNDSKTKKILKLK